MTKNIPASKRVRLPGRRIQPRPIDGSVSVTQLIDEFFHGYNSARIREAAQLLVQKVLRPGVTVGLSITGALTPAGLGTGVFAPLIRAGFVDWIISTGANLYHDLHYAANFALHRATPNLDDVRLKEEGIIRIYDIVIAFDDLIRTDEVVFTMLKSERLQGRMGSAELHYRMGEMAAMMQEARGVPHDTLLTAAYRAGVPVYTSSPGDSTIGMNVAALWLQGAGPDLDVSRDVNETAAIVYDATRKGGKSAAVIAGGGSPKNFLLQTEPQIQEILGLEEKGHDFFIQFTDARPDTGGLSGATPAEAVSWGKIDPGQLPDTVVAYTDATVALPLVASYCLANAKPRKLKRLYDRREAMLKRMREDYLESPMAKAHARPAKR